MKVVVAHNRYGSGQPSGENIVVAREIDQLRAHGVTVLPFMRDSDDIAELSPVQKAMLPVSPVFNRWAARDLAALLDREQPDVVHLHNPYPLISPWIVRVAGAAGVPVVQTVHNYRQVCAAGLYFRGGDICTDCRGRAVGWPAVRHGCYRGSRPQSAIMAAALATHRRTWKGVDRFIALTAGVAEHLRDFGVPADRIVVKPNAIPDPGPPAVGGDGFLFAGRLVPEKGLALLLDAWRTAAAGAGAIGRLRIAGEGPLRASVEAFAAQRPPVEYLGPLTPSGVGAAIAAASCVIVPSTWHDVLPTIAIEALAGGRPVLGTALGGIPWIVGDAGWIVQPTVYGLATGLVRVAHEPVPAEQARLRYEREFAPATLVRRLVGLYKELHESSRARAPRGGAGPGPREPAGADGRAGAAVRAGMRSG
jgi:glycosyltransferase involved in cell wall biosynthesis